MNEKQSPILFLDSGIGGLSVMQAAAKLMPYQEFLYAADYAGAPYGTKSEAEIASRVPALLGRLAERYKPSLIAIACNTACTIALPHVRTALNIPIVGTVPAIKPASLKTTTNVIGLLGTNATIRQSYIDELERRYASQCQLLRHAAPELVNAAEAKMRGELVPETIFKNSIYGLTSQDNGDKIDHIIMGCTHFPLLRDELSQNAPKSIIFLDGADGIARQIKRLMIDNDTPPMVCDPSSSVEKPAHHFITSGTLSDIEAYKPALYKFGFTKFSTI